MSSRSPFYFFLHLQTSALMQMLNVVHKEKMRQKHFKAKRSLSKFHEAQEKQRQKAENALRRKRKEFYQRGGGK